MRAAKIAAEYIHDKFSDAAQTKLMLDSTNEYTRSLIQILLLQRLNLLIKWCLESLFVWIMQPTIFDPELLLMLD